MVCVGECLDMDCHRLLHAHLILYCNCAVNTKK